MAEKRGGDFGASWVASGDLSAAQYRFVRAGANDDVYLPTSGQLCVGILQNKPQDNEHAAVCALGFAKVVVANSLDMNIEIMAGNNGFAVQASSGQWSHGMLLSAANSGLVAEVLLTGGYKKSAS